MNSYTDNEIKGKVAELWPPQSFDHQEIDVRRGDDYIDVQITRMYEAPGLKFSQIDALASFFNTKNVETESEISESGCETCDYYSKYGFVLRVRDGDPVQS